jgi:hypothetical protein
MGAEIKVYKMLTGKFEGKKVLGRPKRRWEYGIRMDIGEIGCGGVEGIPLTLVRDRRRDFVNAVMNLPVLVPQS